MTREDAEKLLEQLTDEELISVRDYVLFLLKTNE